MKAGATITEKTIKLGKKLPELYRISGSSQEEGQTDTKSKSEKHCLKRTKNSSKESSAAICDLQKIMNIGAPLRNWNEAWK